MTDFETPLSGSESGSESDSEGIDTDKGFSERVRQVQEVESEIEEERRQSQIRREREQIESRADEEPTGDIVGPHARILEPEKKAVDGERYLEFQVILPDRTYGILRTEFPVPSSGPVLSQIYEHFDLDPEEATPSDLFKSDVPVRPVEDGPTEGKWVLDLPPESWIRGHCYHYRRDLEERGFSSWDRELQVETDDDEGKSQKARRLERAGDDGIGFILPHSPNTASWWGPAGYLIAIIVAFTGAFIDTGAIQLPYRLASPLMWGGVLLAVGFWFIRHYVLTRSVWSDYIAPSLPGDGSTSSSS
ncbi:hypothetical protein HLRTI_000410 [Halorhabdus tiamatea SARL4B]|uniref:Uncharacterized protein n=1 Tax=Halorhabdus tiamatea SARL4B TaxID=1033806 RepID=U2E571_9EURY|nr:hypothetical protein [Halorhabdus tiamatea]ERJ07368.1 hypothetical protein HLRTI_000410 [Halorhabdus tiamatea SARL4B]